MTKKIIIAIAVIFVLIQLIKIDKTNPTTAPENDFMVVAAPPTEIAKMIKTSCYDCHSSEVVYPWYSNIAPVSWFLKKHINEAREEFSFSEWGLYIAKDQKHIAKECGEEIEKGKMPMTSYLLMHSEAKLSKEQSTQLVSYFKGY